MEPSVDYSAEQDDLYYPCKRGEFFKRGRPASHAALCAEMVRLAYCKQEVSFAFDRQKIADNLHRIEFAKCQFLESRGTQNGEGLHCFFAVRQDSQKQNELAVLAFRGTDKDDPTDVAYDVNFSRELWDKGGQVHGGFAHALAELRKQGLDQLIQSVGCSMLFTGHSLGAALATLAASLRAPQALYTFGSPRVGDAAFVATLDKVECHRYVDCCDIVTRIPLEKMGFRHCGKPYYINRKRKVVFNPNCLTIGTDRILAARDYLFNYTWQLGKVPVRELADHAPINYVWAITADQS
jgi:triacylglycerol lipase